MRRFFQTKLCKTLGKVLALFGVAVTFASCYGMPPEDWRYVPEVWEDENLQQPTDSTATDSTAVASVVELPE